MSDLSDQIQIADLNGDDILDIGESGSSSFSNRATGLKPASATAWGMWISGFFPFREGERGKRPGPDRRIPPAGARFRLIESSRFDPESDGIEPRLLRSGGQVETVQVHHLDPRRHEVLKELLLRVLGSVNLRNRAKL